MQYSLFLLVYIYTVHANISNAGYSLSADYFNRTFDCSIRVISGKPWQTSMRGDLRGSPLA